MNAAIGAGATSFWAGDGTWKTIPYPVASVFGRTGVVVPLANDYSFPQISGNIAISQMNDGASATPTTFWRGDGTWAALPPDAITSVFGRTGVITAATGDHNFNQLSGNIAITQMASGTGASATTFWRGDGTWAVAPGGVTSVFGRTGAVVAVANDYSFSLLSGNIAVSQMNSGNGAGTTTFWRGDGIWAAHLSIPGGSNTQLQYNSSGTFGGIVNAITDGNYLTLVRATAPITPTLGCTLYIDQFNNGVLSSKDVTGAMTITVRP
jgi:hypothetical protein